jgi:hypothetical protein
MPELPAFPRVNYVDSLPEHWIVHTGPGAYWLVGVGQPWATRRPDRGYASALRRPNSETARLVLAALAIPASDCWPATR